MKMLFQNSLRRLLAISIAGAVPAGGEERLVLMPLKTPPNAITEQFYPVEKGGRVDIGGEVIQRMRLKTEEGKSHAFLGVIYENKSPQAVSPKFTVRFYNAYGILMGGVRVPEDAENPPTGILPGAAGATALTPRITRLESMFRHSTLKDYPQGFFSIRWVSISDANTKLGKDMEPRPVLGKKGGE